MSFSKKLQHVFLSSKHTITTKKKKINQSTICFKMNWLQIIKTKLFKLNFKKWTCHKQIKTIAQPGDCSTGHFGKQQQHEHVYTCLPYAWLCVTFVSVSLNSAPFNLHTMQIAWATNKKTWRGLFTLLKQNPSITQLLSVNWKSQTHTHISW